MGIFWPVRRKAVSMSAQRASTFAVWSAATILVSAFLLFQVQPIISKMILPWFGGSSAVWSTCMLFFQMVLLGGYAYAHWLSRTFAPRRQVMIHAVLLVLALLTLPITPDASLRPSDGNNPSLRILTVLALSVGLPYFLLSSTGPLVQAWFGRVYEGKSPYRLYALSNIGSLAALLSYPFWFEPRFALPQQDWFWTIGFGLFAALNGALAWRLWRGEGGEDRRQESGVRSQESEDLAARSVSKEGDLVPPLEQKLLWVLLPALASVALLAVTNHLTQDLAPVPFLWVVPLSLYLLSFILCFDSDRWYVRTLFAPAAMLSVLWICLIEAAPDLDQHCRRMNWSFTATGAIDQAVNGLIDLGKKVIPAMRSLDPFETSDFDYNPVFQGLFYLTSLFLGCMVLHGELARLKPGKRHLTEYYLRISAGGALGGVFVALMCPVLFVWYAELPLAQAGIFLVSGVALALSVFKKISTDRPGSKWLRFAICAVALAGVGTLSGDSAVKHVADPAVRGGISLAMAFVGAALAYGIVATSRRELQVVSSAVAGLLMLSGLFGLVLGSVVKIQDPAVVAAKRSFYGALQVKNDAVSDPKGRWLTHGRIQHGYQHYGPEIPYEKRRSVPPDQLKRYLPTTYYAEGSGIGLAIRHHPNSGRLKIAVVGLGTGTIAAFGQPGEEIRFYEIDQVVKELSEAHFTYRQDTPAKADEVVLGDARLSLEREPPQGYDVIAVDAFSGDAIPVHLLTRECLQVYQKHLNPEGILAIHISNRYLDLAPVVRALGRRGEMRVENFHYEDKVKDLQDTASEWMLLTKNASFFEQPPVKQGITQQENEKTIEWTDQYSNLVDILR